MNPPSGGSNSEFNSSKHNKNRAPFVENASTSTSTARDQKAHSSSTNNNSTWYDGHRDHRRDHDKNRNRSRERDWSRDRERNPHGRGRENNFREEEVRDRFREDQMAYPNYGYNSGTDPSYIDNNRRTLGMMTNLSTYGLIAAMNSSQWAMNPLDGMNMNNNMNPSAAAMSMNPSMDMSTTAGTSMNPFGFMGMPGDCYGMMGMGSFGQLGMVSGETNMIMPQPKEPLHLSKCSLYPPNPNIPPPTTRLKPPGCKTIFVGGLPEKATEEVIKEVFEKCGEIVTIRMSKKNFCHIRYADENCVDSSIYFSGYRIKVDNKDDAPNTGRLHVDFAQARDDFYEYECRQRSLQREARHRERMEQEYYHPPTPPPVVHYSDHEAAVLGEKLRGEDSFQQAVLILITWLERGECTKRNAGYFYSMIQSTNSHVRRLMNEKLKYEDELNKAKLMLKKQMQGILVQFNEIEKVFGAASLQKVWDHFTKAQRKNIELWKKQTEEIKNAHVEEVLNDRIEDEMEVSDDEGDSSSRKAENDNMVVTDQFGNKIDVNKILEELNKVREEADSLRCQLEASENEVFLMKSETDQERDIKDRQMQALREAVKELMAQKESAQKRIPGDETDLKELRPLKKRKDLKTGKEIGENSQDRDEDKTCSDTNAENEITREREEVVNPVSSTSNSLFTITEAEARLIGLISAFLNVHPFGASVDYICSYLFKTDSTVRARDVEALMKKFPTVFKEESTGIGASLEKKWTFCGFKTHL